MKKILAIFSLSLVLGFAGCDSSTGPDSSTSNSALVGIWKRISYFDSSAFSIKKEISYATFSSNGEYSIISVHYYKPGTAMADLDTTRMNGTWNVSSDSLFLTCTSVTHRDSTSTDVKKYSIQFSVIGNTFKTFESDTYNGETHYDTAVFTKATSIILPNYAARSISAASRTSAASSTVTAARRHFLF